MALSTRTKLVLTLIKIFFLSCLGTEVVWLMVKDFNQLIALISPYRMTMGIILGLFIGAFIGMGVMSMIKAGHNADVKSEGYWIEQLTKKNSQLKKDVDLYESTMHSLSEENANLMDSKKFLTDEVASLTESNGIKQKVIDRYSKLGSHKMTPSISSIGYQGNKSESRDKGGNYEERR